MSSHYFDKEDHALLAMGYYDTLVKIDRVEAVLKKLKSDLNRYESAIREIETKNEKQPKNSYIIRRKL